jgi:dienelactone hydrolase
MKNLLFIFMISIAFFTGCGDDTANTVNKEPSYKAGAYMVFNTEKGDIPYPNNILFSKSTDGTLNIPINPSATDVNVKRALNKLDGFSTTSPITIGFDGNISSSTLASGIKVYEVNTTTSAKTAGVPMVKSITKELSFGFDYVATIAHDKIVILPLRPLKSHQNYMVVLTTNITDTQGNPIAPDIASAMLIQTTPLVDDKGNHTTLAIETAKKLEFMRQLTQPMLTCIEKQEGIDKKDIVTVWSFQTQTIGAVAQAFSDANLSAMMSLQDTNLTSADMVHTMLKNAEVYVGTLANLPYYLADANSTHSTAPLTESFVFDTTTQLPKKQSTRTIPVLATIPKDFSMPKNGWPVVIFQHGITQNRTNLLAICESFASVGYAAVAIDLPLHGIVDTTNKLYMGKLERTFNLDLINNLTNEAKPDGKIDPSGIHYINLKALLTSRDNIRQTTSDLIALKNSFGFVVAKDGTKFDPTQVAFVGHSLGTMAPFGFFTHAKLESVSLAMTGGGIAELLNNSPVFGPIIADALAQVGVIKGTDAYNQFILATQTALDDADPINYAIKVGKKQKIFSIEVVGGNGNLSDQVIPNNVATAPLAGSDPLLKYLDATTLKGNATDHVKPNKVARYTIGNHNSILDPTASLGATINMQIQTAAFVQSKGSFITITNTSILNTNYK